MASFRGLFIGIWVIAILAGTAGCTLDDPDTSSNEPALSLTYTQNLSLTILHWDPVKVTGYKEYIVLQSAFDIPDNPTPVINQDVTVLKRINDVEVDSFTATNPVLTAQICYKLYCAVDDRFLYSPTICVDQQIDKINGFFDRACHTEGINEMVMFDRVNDQMSICDYTSGHLSTNVSNTFLSFPSMEMSTWNNTTHVFTYDQSPGVIRVYNFPSLTAGPSKIFNPILWAANVHDQFVYVGTDEFSKNFQVLNRNNLSVVSSRTGLIGNQNVAVFPGNPVIAITIGQTDAIKYSIDASGNIIDQQFVSGRIAQPDLQSSCAEGNELFICGHFGTIINRNGENVGTLNSDPNSFIQMSRLSPDQKKVISLINRNGFLQLQIADLANLPAITVLNTVDLPSLNYADIIPEEELIYVVGTTFSSSQAQTFILQYPW